MKIPRHPPLWRLHVAVLLFLFASSSYANVIYDVVVDYTHTYRYTFSMEFLNDIGPKDESDLIGGDFLDDMFFGRPLSSSPLIQWTYDFEISPTTLSFDPSIGSIAFIVSKVFHPPTTTFTSTIDLTQTQLRINDIGLTEFFPLTTLTISVRAAQTPSPTAFSLIGMGIVGLVLMRRRTKKQQA